MKPILHVFFLCLFFLLGTGTAFATPLNLWGFGTDPGVTVSGSTVTFTEDIKYSAIFFYNDSFLVDPNATFLSFNYSLNLGPDNVDNLDGIIDTDLNVPGFDLFFTIGSTTDPAQPYSFNISGYRGQTISLAFGLVSNDDVAGSVATISNLDLATSTAPIPEPGTLLLLGSGLACLLGVGRKKITRSFK